MVYKLIPSFRYSLFEKEQIPWENGTKTVTTFIVVAAILASPKHRAFT